MIKRIKQWLINKTKRKDKIELDSYYRGHMWAEVCIESSMPFEFIELQLLQEKDEDFVTGARAAINDFISKEIPDDLS